LDLQRLNGKEIKMQTKQTFYVKGENGKVKVRIMEMPWRTKSKTGIPGCRWMEASVSNKTGLCIVGKSVCVPLDEFDFRIGAKLALEDALSHRVLSYRKVFKRLVSGDGSIKTLATQENISLIGDKTVGKIWLEFNRVLPK